MGFKPTIENYKKLIERIRKLEYTHHRNSQLSIHQTINYLIYQFQIALGEIQIKPKYQFLFSFLQRTTTEPDLQDAKKKKDFSKQEFYSADFTHDKELLIEKIKKIIRTFDPYATRYSNGLSQGTSDDHIVQLLKKIDQSIAYFENKKAVKK